MYTAFLKWVHKTQAFVTVFLYSTFIFAWPLCSLPNYWFIPHSKVLFYPFLFTSAGKQEASATVSASASSTPPPPPLSASTSPANGTKSPSSQQGASDTKSEVPSPSQNKLSPRPGTPSNQQSSKGPTSQTVSPKQTGNHSETKSNLKLLFDDDHATPKKSQEAGRPTSPSTKHVGVLPKTSAELPPTKVPGVSSPSMKSSPSKLLSNHNSTAQKSQNKTGGSSVRTHSPIRLNSPLLVGREFTSQPVPHIKPGSSPTPTGQKTQQPVSGGLKQSPPFRVAYQLQQPRGLVITSPTESRKPAALLAHLSSTFSKPPLSSPPLVSKPGSPSLIPLDLTPAKHSVQSPRQAKSPIASHTGSKSPRGSSPIAKSPSHKSPGRHSPAQVAPLDLRAKPPVSEGTPTSSSWHCWGTQLRSQDK